VVAGVLHDAGEQAEQAPDLGDGERDQAGSESLDHGPLLHPATARQLTARLQHASCDQREDDPLDGIGVELAAGRGEDVDALLASLTTLRDLAIFLLVLDGGLRPDDVLCLQLEDTSYGRRWVTVRKRDDHRCRARAKARHERVVDLHEPRTLDAVNRYVLPNASSRLRARSCSWSAGPVRAAANS